ncbi:MAG: tRNA pseudouridine(38-40) synthase TruA [Clostridiales bacterium]|nr:tRNA pseudouridine(38-40) synthase TruA [Clostridiales bacterium]
MKNILLTIEYDGTNFHGWQRQPGQRTVQGEIEKVLSKLFRQEVTITATSRTDSGVHALYQKANFKGDFGIPTERIPLAANNLLSGDVRIKSAEEVDLDFHARFDAVGKKYIYIIRNASYDFTQRNFCYHIEKQLDHQSMKEAAQYLVGEQDFKSFMAAGGKVPESTVRTIYSANFTLEPIDKGRKIVFEIIGNGFLYNMVRIIVGTLVDIGLGKISASDMKEIIESCNRSRAGHTAPPQGLYLSEIYFDYAELKKSLGGVNK